MINIPKHDLTGVLAHASKDETRPHLCAVYVEVGASSRLVSTDGHRMALWCSGPLHPSDLATGPHETALLTRASVARAHKLIPASGSAIIERAEGERSWSAQPCDRNGVPVGPRIPLDLSTGQFPPWRQVFPRQRAWSTVTPCARWCVNADYVADAAQFCASGKVGGAVFLPGSDELDPLLVRSTTEDRWSVVMPMRV